MDLTQTFVSCNAFEEFQRELRSFKFDLEHIVIHFVLDELFSSSMLFFVQNVSPMYPPAFF